MKNNVILFLMFCSLSCRAQIQNELEGVWLPEKYVLARMENDTSSVDQFLFPVEGFIISKKEIENYLSGEGIKESNEIILIKAYKSEVKPTLSERVTNNDKSKYKLLHLYAKINMNHTPEEVILRLKEADIYLSKEGSRLLLEIIEKEKQENIYFINGINDYQFKDFEDANRYLKNNASATPNKTVKKEYSGIGGTTKEIPLAGKETSLKLSYEFYKEPDELIVYDQSGRELHRTGTRATTKIETTTVDLYDVTKLIFKIESKEVDSRWRFSVEVK